MLTLTSFSSSERSSAILSSTGATAWHGPHHSAQKSTITGLSLWSTSLSNVVSVTAVTVVDIRFLSLSGPKAETSAQAACFPPVSRIERVSPAFAPLPEKPDHPALEQDVLDWWEREGIFDELRARNRGGPRFSF